MNDSVDVAICGAGIAGIAAAWHLAQRIDPRRVLIIEPDAPLSLTSDKSTECYRNWWPGPDDAMACMANRSIDLLEQLARSTDNAIRLDRRGYLYLSADPAMAQTLANLAMQAEQLGAGALRVHDGSQCEYIEGRSDGFEDQPEGADLLLEPARIHTQFPYASPKTCVALHVRRCGTLSAQQLGMVMLEQARELGVQTLKGEVVAIDTADNRVSALHVRTNGEVMELACHSVVNAAGPYLAHVARMVGLALPVVCERHAKLTFSDRHGIFPRWAPLSIWCDPTSLPWCEDERDALSESEDTMYLTQPFVSGVHGRPVGSGDAAMLYWTYDCPVEEPNFPITWDPHYAEILMRGMSVMVPGLASYYQHIPNAYVDGGYYTKTRENRPLIGPTPVHGFHLMGGFSGFGIMTAMAAGELLAEHVCNSPLPKYARAFSLERYEDPAYLAALENPPPSGQI